MRIAIIGAGAAGCFAAANIPYLEGREVVIFEKHTKALQKLKVSGGGRCNVTHDLNSISELVLKYPRGKNLLKKTLHHFKPLDTVRWFQERGVELKTENDGRMFPVSDNSQTIIDCIMREIQKNRIEIHYQKSVSVIHQLSSNFEIVFSDKTTYKADKIIIAPGGYAKPNQYEWIKQLGHSIEAPVPSLFTFNLPGHSIKSLQGVTVNNVSLKILQTKISTTGPLLITHWGLSGPAVLKASAWGAKAIADTGYEFNIHINWLHDVAEETLKAIIQNIRIEEGRKAMKEKNRFLLPKRLWIFLLEQAAIQENTKWGELKAREQNKLIELLLRYPLHVKGKTSFKEEFVTCGGVQLSEIHPQTMESKIVPNIYFAGEILNVDGITGGFNFQHAWVGAWLVANAVK